MLRELDVAIRGKVNALVSREARQGRCHLEKLPIIEFRADGAKPYDLVSELRLIRASVVVQIPAQVHWRCVFTRPRPDSAQELDARSAKTSAKKVKEGRDIYVSDEMLELVCKHASPIVQDVPDLAYLTGQRPADVLSMRWNSIHEGKVEIRQGKTGKKLRIREEGDLKKLLDRIRARDAAQKEAAETGEEFIRFQLRAKAATF